jgi:flagellar hook assembly protein FlgD
VEIRIYSQTGKLIRELPGTTNNGGSSIGWNRVEWNGEDKNGKVVGNDVYFIAIEAKFADGTKKTMRQKCVKIK